MAKYDSFTDEHDPMWVKRLICCGVIAVAEEYVINRTGKTAASLPILIPTIIWWIFDRAADGTGIYYEDKKCEQLI